MNIVEKCPCTISLNTHGGAIIDVEFAHLSSRIDGRWSVLMKGESRVLPDGYDTLPQAFVAAAERLSKSVGIETKGE